MSHFLVVKCEYFNAGGSVKDRIAKNMIEAAEAEGRLKRGKSTLIEPTSGNTGIGLALVSAVRGYRLLITMPQKMSQEKCDMLELLGATVRKTPSDAPSASPRSHIAVANAMHAEIENSEILDQYSNPCNPNAHYAATAVEMLRQCGGKIDTIVVGAGTGGSISGIARRLKEALPGVKVVGVDPMHSVLSQSTQHSSQEDRGDLHSKSHVLVEGIGYDFIPGVLDRTLVDTWIRAGDKESFLMARRLIRSEALLCGGSSGSAVWAAVNYAKQQQLPSGHRIVVLLPDTVRNYMSKFVSDYWMVKNDFMPPPSRVQIAPVLQAQKKESLFATIEKFVRRGNQLHSLCIENCKFNHLLSLFSKNNNQPIHVLHFTNGKFLEAGNFLRYFPELRSGKKVIGDLLLGVTDLTETTVCRLNVSSNQFAVCEEFLKKICFLFEKYSFLLVEVEANVHFQISRANYFEFCAEQGIM